MDKKTTIYLINKLNKGEIMNEIFPALVVLFLIFAYIMWMWAKDTDA